MIIIIIIIVIFVLHSTPVVELELSGALKKINVWGFTGVTIRHVIGAFDLENLSENVLRFPKLYYVVLNHLFSGST